MVVNNPASVYYCYANISPFILLNQLKFNISCPPEIYLRRESLSARFVYELISYFSGWLNVWPGSFVPPADDDTPKMYLAGDFSVSSVNFIYLSIFLFVFINLFIYNRLQGKLLTGYILKKIIVIFFKYNIVNNKV